ncbi:putative cytochrome P450 [Rosellinia necatrix]|uniref:Putative cytochrome P450 n=1 Tax=Rosellinia necatrix TaxID=77044 RepID=A0A1W2TCH9_ROSNE|nr:putative cytochrome P450 [Rosellinia necatrix]
MKPLTASLLAAADSFEMQGSLLGRVVLSLVTLGLLNCLRLIIWRLYFSPIAKFPGPTLAALTFWYGAYYDIVHEGGGQLTFQIKRLHEKYGPIVRISPDELHIDDPAFYDEVYCNSHSSRPIDKLNKFKYRLNLPESVVSTVYAEEHRRRRAALAPFFSKSRTRSYNGNVQDIVDRISHRLSTEFRGRVIDLYQVWACLTADTIRELAFGLPPVSYSAPNFESPFPRGIQSFVRMAHYTTHFQFLGFMFQKLPDAILGALLPTAQPILDYRREIQEQVSRIMTGKNIGASESAHPTIFHEILASSDLPHADLSADRLGQEGMLLNGAGIETTSWTLTLISFYILDNTSIQRRLKAELEQAMPNADEILPWEELEKLPYLSAIVWEGLRLSFGSVQRLPRVNRLGSWVYGDLVIPPNTPVSMDAYHNHTNAAVFPSPLEFRPERWLGDPKGPDGATPLSHYVVSFSRGARGCLGMNLAFLELYVALATVFRRHELELFETTLEDVEFAVDLIRPMPKWGSKGVRATVVL